jgi:hypothetical protein
MGYRKIETLRADQVSSLLRPAALLRVHEAQADGSGINDRVVVVEGFLPRSRVIES